MNINRPEDAEILLQKLPSDMGIHRNPRKGTLNAPEKILEGLKLDGEVFIDEVFPEEFDLAKAHENIYENTVELSEYERPLVSIGGDHSISYPIIKALKEKFPDMQLVWLDSHLDLKEKIGENNSHDVIVRELLDSGLFSEDEIFFVGVTKIDHDEEKFLEEHDLKIYRPEELSKFIKEYSCERPCYLSVDIDVLTEELAPGTGYPDGQLSLESVEKVVEKSGPDFADLVEVAPPFDEENVTVDNAGKILSRLVEEVKD